MSASITAQPGILENRSGWTFPPWFSLIIRKIQRALLSDAEERVLHLAQYAAGTFGAPLLEAQSLDDLDDRIDAALERPEMYMLLGLSAHSLTSDMLDRTEAIEPGDRELEVFGLGNASLLREALLLMAQAAFVFAVTARAQGVDETQRAASELWGEPLAFLSDPGIPPAVGLAMLGGLKANVCSYAMAEALFAGKRLEPWLARAILERWIEGERRYLCLMASMPGVDVPTHIIPMADRLDILRIDKEHLSARRRVGLLLEEAREARADVYPGRAEPGDE